MLPRPLRYTLMVVDMQVGFPAVHKIASKVKKEIKIAKQLRNPIIFFEVNKKHNGETLPSLWRAVKDYSHVCWLHKDRDDGSDVAFRHFETAPQFKTGHYLVCGVNTEYCVLKTAQGMAKRLRPDSSDKVVVLSGCCNSSTGCTGAKAAEYIISSNRFWKLHVENQE